MKHDNRKTWLLQPIFLLTGNQADISRFPHRLYQSASKEVFVKGKQTKNQALYPVNPQQEKKSLICIKTNKECKNIADQEEKQVSPG
ncbi:MAG: hypothetical protein MZU84_07470 [Sphingobacterium sp.]|nr:hypothetical protein [Sphingobacterium sp.]